MLSVKARRALAKAIDLVAFAGFLSLGVRWFDSPWAGLAIGGAYLLLCDALGMSAKNWAALGVIDVATGRRCSLASSILRNSPWLAAPLFRTALVSFHAAAAAPGSGEALAYDVARGVVGAIGIAVAVTLWRGLGDGSGRHWADALAGTQVISLKPGEAVRPPPAFGDVSPRKAVDFDDAAERDAGSRAPRRPKPRSKDRDAVDFDDAN